LAALFLVSRPDFSRTQMNRTRWLAQFSLFLFAILMGCAAFAQESPRTGTAGIPFDFYIGGNKLPADQYTLNIIAPT
jgi:hypothetical protein